MDKLHDRIAWIIIILLLLLRIPYILAVTYFLPIEDQSGGAVYELGTYALTAFLIWWERGRLADFHIDRAALYLFAMLRPIQTLVLAYWKVESPLAFPSPAAVILLGISIVLMIALYRSASVPAPGISRSFRWLGIGILAGSFVSIAENYPAFASMLHSVPGARLTPALALGALNLIYHLGFAPLNEEPLFRGFLWGYLRQLKWNEISILFFQAALFTCAHVYLAAQYPLQFWILTPAAALLFGWLAWRGRSIAPAMLAHGLINASVYVLLAALVRAIR